MAENVTGPPLGGNPIDLDREFDAARWYAIGIAMMVRKNIVRCTHRNLAIQAPIADWLDASGVNAVYGARKHGRSFWEDESELLTRVAEEGKFGMITRNGSGSETLLSLKLEETIRQNYEPLFESERRHKPK
jgi:hypothetical protein